LIEAARASLCYLDHGREVYACRDVSLRVESGEFLGILGPSGSGKSSLLYLLSGLKLPTSGEVRIDGHCFARMGDERRARLRLLEFGFVFQYPFLLGYLSALENVRIARPGEDRTAEAMALLETLGIDGKAHRMPHELSGGERQRVCVARALLGSPRAIFADEPTASLDRASGEHVVALLNQHRGEGALVMVTHDPSMLQQADRVVTLEDGVVL
jgi:putative ABC transport system ATP-binding protein